MYRFLISLALGFAGLVATSGCEQGDVDAPRDSSASATSGSSLGRLVDGGFVSDRYGFSVGFGDSWKPQFDRVDYPGIASWGGRFAAGNVKISLSSERDSLETLLYLSRGASSFNVVKRSADYGSVVGPKQRAATSGDFMRNALVWQSTPTKTWTETRAPHDVELGGKAMVRQDGACKWQEMSVGISQLVYLVDDGATAMIITLVGANPSDSAELEAILQTVRFH